jgi:hypothetical protein
MELNTGLFHMQLTRLTFRIQSCIQSCSNEPAPRCLTDCKMEVNLHIYHVQVIQNILQAAVSHRSLSHTIAGSFHLTIALPPG